MRKLLLLMIALLAGVSEAWAETNYFLTTKTAASSITSGNYYVIDGRDQVGASLHFLFDNGTKVTSNNPQDIPSDPAAVGKFIWQIVGNAEDGYTLQNLATGKYMSLGGSDGSQISSSDTPQTNGIHFAEIEDVTYATIRNSNGQAIDIGYWGNNPTTWSGNSTPAGSRRLVIYEVEPVEIVDDACYTIGFVSKDETKTWGLRAATSETTANASGTGDVFVAHSYTNLAGNKRWIFVNNSDGTYLAYHGQANSSFNISHAINEWNISTLTAGSGNVAADAPVVGKLCITNDKRYTNNASAGCYILKEANGAYDNSSAPYYSSSYTSALQFTATGDAVSSAASLAIAKFDALNEVRGYLTYASNISALFASPTSIETNINAAATAEAAATIATNFMKSPEGKKFYANPSTATSYYVNLGASQITATATKLYAEAALEVEYAGNRKYYLKGVKSGYYAGNPVSGTTNPGTVSSKGSATPLYIGNYANSVDNVVYFARTTTGGYIEAIHYNSGYTAAGSVVAWTYNAAASQWNITPISDEDYENLCNVCDVTYNVIVEPSGGIKATSSVTTEVIGAAFTTPGDAAKDFASYTFYSDVACTSELTVVPNAAEATVYALAAADAPFTVSTNYASAIWYNLRLRNAYPSYADATPNVTLPTAPSTTEDNVEWAFIGNPYDGYQIINKAAGDGKVLGAASAASDGDTGANTYATFATAGTQTYERWLPKSSTHATNGFYLFDGEGYALNKRSNANLAFWTGGYDMGSTFEAFAVTDNSAELTEIADNLAAKTYGSEYGEYSLTGDYAGYENQMAGTIIPGLGTYSYYNLLVARGLDAAKSLNVPQTGDFLRIKASATNKSAYSVGSDIYLTSSNTQSDVNGGTYKDKRVGFNVGAANDNTTIFYYDGTKLTGLANGLHPSSSSNQMKIGAVGVSTSIAFESIESTENKAFRVEFKADDGKTDRSLYTQRYSGVYFTDAAGGNATDTHYRYFLEKVTSLPVTISSVGYSTFYSPVALTIPGGVTAYIASDEGDYLHLTAIDGGTIPANTGVILAGEAGTYNFAITTGGSVDSNELTGTVAAIARPADSYVLSGGDNGLGFYADGAETIPGFKAYLPSASVKGFLGFNFDGADAIQAIGNGQLTIDNDKVIYNLAGQRVSKLQRGVNIINGKKVVVK